MKHLLSITYKDGKGGAETISRELKYGEYAVPEQKFVYRLLLSLGTKALHVKLAHIPESRAELFMYEQSKSCSQVYSAYRIYDRCGHTTIAVKASTYRYIQFS